MADVKGSTRRLVRGCGSSVALNQLPLDPGQGDVSANQELRGQAVVLRQHPP
jgi:hypothetical protein